MVALADAGNLEDDEWEVVEEYEDVEVDGDEEVRLVRIAEDKPMKRKQEQTWEEQLAALGLQRAYINKKNNLILPHRGVEYVIQRTFLNSILLIRAAHRQNVRKGRVISDYRVHNRTTRIPVGMIANSPHSLQDRVVAARDRTKMKKINQRSEMRYVKTNLNSISSE